MYYGCYYLKNLIYKIVLLLFSSIFLNAGESNKVQFVIENQLKHRVISKEIKSLIFDVIQFYDNKNSLKINEIISKDIGLYFIFDTYNNERFWNSKKICFSTCKEEYFPLSYFYEELNNQKILKNKQIKKIIYIRDSSRKRLLKVIQKTKERLQINGDLTKVLKKELLKEEANVEKWEKDSIEVILMYKNNFKESAFRFFITKIKENWYLTIIDFTPTNIFRYAQINTSTQKSLHSFYKTTEKKRKHIKVNKIFGIVNDSSSYKINCKIHKKLDALTIKKFFLHAREEAGTDIIKSNDTPWSGCIQEGEIIINEKLYKFGLNLGGFGYIDSEENRRNNYSCYAIGCPELASFEYRIENINNPTHKSLYSFCKSIGIKESEIRALNPWINKEATNIPPNAEIIIPNINKEEGKR